MAFEVFHHQIGYGLAAGASDAEIGDVDDVRMAQQPDGLRLAPEPLDEFAVAGQLRRHDFDGDATARARMSRAIDRPIPARPQSASISYFPSSNGRSFDPSRERTFSAEAVSASMIRRCHPPNCRKRLFPSAGFSKKVIVFLVRLDERLNLTLKRGVVLNRARNEPRALFLGAFGRFMEITG